MIQRSDQADKIRYTNGFSEIQKFLDRFDLSSFHDPVQIKDYAEHFALLDLCRDVDADKIVKKVGELDSAVSSEEDKPIPSDFGDLCRLHWLCLSRRCVNILEFGSGYSTIVQADALKHLSKAFEQWVGDNVRVQVPFHLFAIEEEQRFLEVTKQRLNDELLRFVTLQRSSVNLGEHDSRFVTYYSHLPNISPDLIYLDAPSQYATTERLCGFGIDDKVRMPMAADLLRIEFFLEPGTLIVVDGRTANARFLKSYLRQNWVHWHDIPGDVHYFELQEEPLGHFNELKMRFCLGGRWLL